MPSAILPSVFQEQKAVPRMITRPLWNMGHSMYLMSTICYCTFCHKSNYHWQTAFIVDMPIFPNIKNSSIMFAPHHVKSATPHNLHHYQCTAPINLTPLPITAQLGMQTFATSFTNVLTWAYKQTQVMYKSLVIRNGKQCPNDSSSWNAMSTWHFNIKCRVTLIFHHLHVMQLHVNVLPFHGRVNLLIV